MAGGFRGFRPWFAAARQDYHGKMACWSKAAQFIVARKQSRKQYW